MKDSSIHGAGRKKDWALTPDAWHQLLAWLDQGTDSGGKRYLEMRRRLVRYFDRRNCLTPDELADETLNRVARRFEEEGTPKLACSLPTRRHSIESLPPGIDPRPAFLNLGVAASS